MKVLSCLLRSWPGERPLNKSEIRHWQLRLNGPNLTQGCSHCLTLSPDE